MLAVPRDAFVPQNQRGLAYLDLDLDVSEGSSAKRYLIKPVVTAKMLQRPRSRTPTMFWWSAAPPDMRRPSWPSSPAG